MLSTILKGAKSASTQGVIYVESSSVAAVGSGVADITIDKPTGASDGDLIMAFLRGGGNTSVRTITPSISGWTEEVAKTSAAAPTSYPNPFYVFSRVVDGDGSTYTFTRSGTSGTYDGVLCLLKDGSALVDVVGDLSGANSSTHTAPSITPTQNGIALVCFSWNGTRIISSSPSGVDVVNIDLDNDGNNGTTVIYSSDATAGVATGDKTLTLNAAENGISVQISVY